MTLLDRDAAVLLVVDFQDKLLAKIPEAHNLCKQASVLIRFARTLSLPVLWTEQYPAGLGPTAAVLSTELEGLRPVAKMAFGCFGEPAFVEAIEAVGRRQLLITGIETHVCVMQTVLAALERNYEAYVVRDAVGARRPSDHEAGLARMQAAGAQLVSAEMAVFEVLRVAGTPEFRRVLPLVK